MSEPLRLNIGAGEDPAIHRKGYLNLDRKFGDEAYPLRVKDRDGLPAALRNLPSEFRGYLDGDCHLSLPANSIDEIVASHVLEHFSHRITGDVLREWNRVLKPGGTLKVAVPDFDWIVTAFESGKSAELPLECFLMGGHGDDDDHHGAMFNDGKLRELLRSTGFGCIRPWKSTVEDCASMQGLSLNLAAVKCAAEYPSLRGQVAACFSVPRFGPLDSMFVAMEAFTKMNIPAIRKGGAFWHQCLSDCFEIVMNDAKYVMALDYDSIFRPEDVWQLYCLMEDHPEADAICPMQAGRDRSTPLMTVAGENGKNRAILTPEEMANELLDIRTGHFGLTLIKSDVLRKMSKPWFMPKPDDKGGWGEGRVDADISFWLKFRDEGFRVFQANRVTIGHGQWMCSFPDRNLETRHLYMSEYQTSGKPEWAWR